jgi:hypothetical protein
LWDHFAGAGTWWEGYVHQQLLASATGARMDGHFAFWFPFRTIAGRFWPGLPLVLLGVWQALRRASSGQRDTAAEFPEVAAVRTVALFSVLLLLGLCLPARKLWNHALVAYPGLALLAGAGAAPLVERFLRDQRRQRTAVAGLVLLALVAGVSSAAGLGRLLIWQPCLSSSGFARELDRLAPGSPVAVVATSPQWRIISSLAAERRLAPAPVENLADASSLHARVALVEEVLLQTPPAPEGWREVRRARGWVLLERAP